MPGLHLLSSTEAQFDALSRALDEGLESLVQRLHGRSVAGGLQFAPEFGERPEGVPVAADLAADVPASPDENGLNPALAHDGLRPKKVLSL